VSSCFPFSLPATLRTDSPPWQDGPFLCYPLRVPPNEGNFIGCVEKFKIMDSY
jgi:hypothetical protein